MSIEESGKRIPKFAQEKRLWERVLSYFRKSREAPIEEEFYNQDRTMRYCFYEWLEGDSFRQLNVSLQCKIGQSWCGMMTAMTRWEGDQEQAFGIEVEGLVEQDNLCLLAHYYYDYATGGEKRFSGITTRPLGLPDESAKQILTDLGFLDENNLPEFIDFERTIKQFMIKAKSFDFSSPELIPKPLIH